MSKQHRVWFHLDPFNPWVLGADRAHRSVTRMPGGGHSQSLPSSGRSASPKTERRGCGCQTRFGIPFWLVGEFTTHFLAPILVVGSDSDVLGYHLAFEKPMATWPHCVPVHGQSVRQKNAERSRGEDLFLHGTIAGPGVQTTHKTNGWVHMGMAPKTGIPKWLALGSGKNGPKPAVCPSSLILSHCHITAIVFLRIIIIQIRSTLLLMGVEP